MACVLFVGFQMFPHSPVETNLNYRNIWNVREADIAKSVTADFRLNAYPKQAQIQTKESTLDAVIHYNTNPSIDERARELLTHYKPDYAAVIALDATNGKILTLSSYSAESQPFGNLAIHAGYPAASIFKIITAAAAVEQNLARPDTIYQYNGKTTTLYKSNVFNHKRTKYTRDASLSRAFALSINTVFGRIGVHDVGGQVLKDYADTFGFNRPLPVDIDLEPSKTGFELTDDWSIAEAASGFTRKTTISPVHAAMIVSAIVNDGVLVEPRIVEFAHLPDGPLIYDPIPKSTQVINEETAKAMRVMMRATVKRGSARKHFRSFFNSKYKDIDVGGKTGSLTGTSPKG